MFKKYLKLLLLIVATVALMLGTFVMVFHESIFVKVATDKSPGKVMPLNAGENGNE